MPDACQGRTLRAAITPQTAAVALSVDNPRDEVVAVVAYIAPHFLQFHGDETDAASGVELATGIKDGDKMLAFIAAVHRADRENTAGRCQWWRAFSQCRRFKETP